MAASASSSLAGVYYDAKHGGCIRIVRATANPGILALEGAYGEHEAGAPGHPWQATIQATGHFLTVDFHGKITLHEQVYHALWCPKVREIHWEDGSVWKKLYAQGSA